MSKKETLRYTSALTLAGFIFLSSCLSPDALEKITNKLPESKEKTSQSSPSPSSTEKPSHPSPVIQPIGAPPPELTAGNLPPFARDFASLSGRVELPPVHPRNLYPRRRRSSNHEAGHQAMNIPDELNDRVMGPMKPSRDTVVSQGELRLDKLLKVRAIPIPPPKDEKNPFIRPLPEGEELDIARESHAGEIDASGNFLIQVPPYQYGYIVTVSGGKVHMKYRLQQDIQPRMQMNDLTVTVQSTLIASASAQASNRGRDLSNDDIKNKLGNGLAQAEANLKEQMRGTMRGRAWNKKARELSQGVGFSVAQTSSGSFTGCSSSPTNGICYDSTEDVLYNLTSSTEMPADTKTLSFDGSAIGSSLRNQYSASQGVSFAAYREGALFTKRLGSPMPIRLLFGSVREVAGGFATVRPPANGGGVTISFTEDSDSDGAADGVRSVGLTIQNGTSHSGSGSTSERRPFRFVPIDSTGSPIHEYRWYTNQNSDGPAFYGITSPELIYGLRIIVRDDTDPFTIGNLMYSPTYQGDTALDGTGYTLKENLGWRAAGNWSKQGVSSPRNASFNHPYYNGSSVGSRGQYIHSEGAYWHCNYGSSSPENTLSAPAFTLGNMDLDADDANTALNNKYWLVGLSLDEINGVSDFTLTASDPTLPRSYTMRDLAICEISGNCNSYLSNWVDWRASGYGNATMGTHWSHVHWQSYIAVDDAAVNANSTQTERYVEYSTDNGTTWRTAYWYEDDSHHGKNGYWWNNHMHPYENSHEAVMYYGEDFDGNSASQGTDFDKDGSQEYVAPNDSSGSPSHDPREWDTEFYMEYSDPSTWTDVDGDGYLDSDIEGSSVIYRYRFAGNTAPTSCNQEVRDRASATDTDGDGVISEKEMLTTRALTTCDGWKIDDVAFNNDDPTVGYFTDFDGSYNYNLD